MHISTVPKFALAVLCLAGAALPLHAGAQSGVQRVSFEQGDREPYALVRSGARTTFVGRYHDDNAEIDALKPQFGNHFVWFRRAGKAYVVRDPATLATIDAAWTSTDKLGGDMKKFDDQMRVQSKAMAALSRDMAHATRDDMEATGKRMETLGKTMDALGKQMDALGKQIDRESKLADATTRSTLRDALEGGKAVPAAR